MQAIELEPSVCGINIFSPTAKNFWMGDLRPLLARCPMLEVPHRQDFYMLMLVHHGEGLMKIDEHSLRLETNKVIIVKPNCISSIDLFGEAHVTAICFTDDFFSLRYNNNILYEFCFLQQNTLPYVRLNPDQQKKWDSLLALANAEFKCSKRDSENLLRSYLNILLFELERMYKPLGIAKTPSLQQEKIRAFEHLINKHFRTKKLPSAYAELLCISANYLNKLCKEERGETAGDIIRKRIMLEAQRLLHYTNYTINEIADKLGFENVSYFVTFFKKHAADTPEGFRKKPC